MKLKKILFMSIAVFIFIMPAAVSAKTLEAVFSDLPETRSHYHPVMQLTHSGYISGYEDGTFKPDQAISRQHVALILSNLRHLNPPEDLDRVLADYTDVDAGHPYAQAIAAVTQAGIFSGNAQGEFRPSQPITREQMATVLNNIFELHDFGAEHVAMNLDNVSASHRDAVQIFANLGLTVALEDFKPRDPVTRGQFATFVVGAMDIVIVGIDPIFERWLDDAALERMLDLVNDARAEVGAKPLEYSDRLINFAQFRAEDMADNSYFSHNSPRFGSFEKMFYEHLYPYYVSAGENIAQGYGTVEDVFEGWMNSPGHKRNILDGDYEYIGFAYHPEGDYWVQVFGTR